MVPFFICNFAYYVNAKNHLIEQYCIAMDKKEIFNRIEYVVACVGAFAQRYNLSNMQAYAYLRRFTGIDFLLDCYAAEHTLSIEDAVSDLQVICQREGGKI